MASLFKQLFSQTPEEGYATDGESILSGNHKIISLLYDLNKSSSTLNLFLSDDDIGHQSKILTIDESTKIFTLSKVNSTEGHEALLGAETFQVHAQLSGATIIFNSRVKKFHYSAQLEYYEIAIPELLNYIQRRASYRVEINSTHLIPITAELKQNQKKIYANVHDIAMQGIGIIAKAIDSIKPGDELSCCQLQLSNDEIINFTLDVKHVIPMSPGTVRIGGSFKDLNHRSTQLIGRLVRDMERLRIGN